MAVRSYLGGGGRGKLHVDGAGYGSHHRGEEEQREKGEKIPQRIGEQGQHEAL